MVEDALPEREPRRGLAEGEPEKLSAVVAEAHPVLVTELVEVTEGERETATDGEEDTDAWMDAVPVVEADEHTVPVDDATGEMLRPGVSDTVVLADTLGLLLGELDTDAHPELVGVMDSDGETLDDAEVECDTVAVEMTLGVLDKEVEMVPEREPVWVREEEGVLEGVLGAEPDVKMLRVDFIDRVGAAEAVLEMHTLADTQPEGDSEEDTDAVYDVLCVEDTEGDPETEGVGSGEVVRPTERDTEGEGEEDVHKEAVVQTVEDAVTVGEGVTLMEKRIEELAVTHALGEAVAV